MAERLKMFIDQKRYEKLVRQRDIFRSALHKIHAQDPVENVLDPQWAARIAGDALRKTDQLDPEKNNPKGDLP